MPYSQPRIDICFILLFKERRIKGKSHNRNDSLFFFLQAFLSRSAQRFFIEALGFYDVELSLVSRCVILYAYCGYILAVIFNTSRIVVVADRLCLRVKRLMFSGWA